jgi:hypothetical protein
MSEFLNAAECYSAHRARGLPAQEARKKTALIFNISEEAVRKSYNRHKEYHTFQETPPRRALTYEEEETVVAFCIIHAAISLPLSCPDLQAYVSKNYVEVGDKWPHRFLERQKERLSLVREQILVNSKDPVSNKLILRDVDRFASAWPEFVKTEKLSPDQVITFDETLLNRQPVNARSIKSKKSRYNKTRGDRFESGGSLTIFVNAAGRHILSLYCIKRGKSLRNPPKAILYDLPYYTRSSVHRAYCYTINGYITEAILKNAQQKVCDLLEKSPTKGKLLVFLCDQLEVHKKKNVIDNLYHNGCRLFLLVGGATEVLAPLDKISFGVFKKKSGQLLRKANATMAILDRMGKKFFRSKFFWQATYDAEEATIKEGTTRNAFRTTGIWPPNSKVIKSCFESMSLDSILPVPENEKTLADKIVERIHVEEKNALSELDRVNNKKRKVAIGEDGSAVFLDRDIILDIERQELSRKKVKVEKIPHRKKSDSVDLRDPDVEKNCLVQ